jgi:tetraacyldisaccharide 4'-kinase
MSSHITHHTSYITQSIFDAITTDASGYRLLKAIAHGLSLLYAGGLKFHQLVYKKGWLEVKKPPCKVISVGNLTVGGTGKTPFVIFLARFLREMGKKVAVVTRGYKARSNKMLISDGNQIFLSPLEAGDEGYLLAKNLKNIPVLKGKERYRVITFAFKRFGSEIVVLDDAFQHYALKKDLEIVLLATERPFGNGYLLPRGILREPISALNRAEAVVLTKIKEEAKAMKLKQVLSNRFPHLKIFTTQTKITSLFDAFKAIKPLSSINATNAIAFCGIAKPKDFYQTCLELGLKIIAFLPFADHHIYTQKDIQHLIRLAREKKVKVLVTTEKDAVKLFSFKKEFVQAGLQLVFPKLEMSIVEKEVFGTWLKEKLGF